MSVTADTSHVPIGPCGPCEQSVNLLWHFLIADCSSALYFGAQPTVGYYYRGHTIGVKMRVRVMIRVRVRVTLWARRSAWVRGLEPGFSWW